MFYDNMIWEYSLLRWDSARYLVRRHVPTLDSSFMSGNTESTSASVSNYHAPFQQVTILAKSYLFIKLALFHNVLLTVFILVQGSNRSLVFTVKRHSF